MGRWFTLVYIVFLVIFLGYRFWKKAKVDKETQGKGVIYYKSIYTAQYGTYAAHGIACILEYFLVSRKLNLAVSVLGLAILLGGTFARKTAVKALGKQWSSYIEIKPNHQLIKMGIYQYLRHPNSLFLLLEICGFTLIPNAYYMLLVIILLTAPLTFVRIHFEENALIMQFGQEYLDYKKQVPAVLPFKLIHQLVTKGRL